MIPTIESSKVSYEELIKPLDGIVLHGGVDIAPETYGEKVINPLWKGDRLRDLYELELISAGIKLNKPILGICRGMQMINIFFGGSLYQDINFFSTEGFNSQRCR